MKFSIKDFFSKCDQIRRKLPIWSHLLKKSLMENFIVCAVDVWELIFVDLQYLKNYSRKLHSNFSKVPHQVTIDQTFSESMSRGALSVLTSLS